MAPRPNFLQKKMRSHRAQPEVSAGKVCGITGTSVSADNSHSDLLCGILGFLRIWSHSVSTVWVYFLCFQIWKALSTEAERSWVNLGLVSPKELQAELPGESLLATWNLKPSLTFFLPAPARVSSLILLDPQSLTTSIRRTSEGWWKRRKIVSRMPFLPSHFPGCLLA